MELYIQKLELIKAVQCEYQAFWANPFDHETKLKNIIDRHRV